jgi:hypothetical protein
LIHNANTVNHLYEDAMVEAKSITAAALGVGEIPILIPQAQGDRATVSLRGVIGLTAVVERAARLIDVLM